MSALLTSELTIQSKHDVGYWWPLYFEAMRRIGFGYVHPNHRAEYLGTYYCWADDYGNNDVAAEGASFRELWDIISLSGCSPVVEFWPAQGEGFLLQGLVERHDSNYVRILLQLPAEYLSPNSPANTSSQIEVERICAWLNGARQLYSLCAPSDIAMAWERNGDEYVVGMKVMQDGSHGIQNELGAWQKLDIHLGVQRLLVDNALQILNPFPIPSGRGWKFISLDDCLR